MPTERLCPVNRGRPDRPDGTCDSYLNAHTTHANERPPVWTVGIVIEVCIGLVRGGGGGTEAMSPRGLESPPRRAWGQEVTCLLVRSSGEGEWPRWLRQGRPGAVTLMHLVSYENIGDCSAWLDGATNHQFAVSGVGDPSFFHPSCVQLSRMYYPV